MSVYCYLFNPSSFYQPSKSNPQKSDVGLSEEQLEQLLDKLDVDGDGEINFRL